METNDEFSEASSHRHADDGFKNENRSDVTGVASIHVPVLPNEVISWLVPPEMLTRVSSKSSADKTIFVDGTLGAGGHSMLLAQKICDHQRSLGGERQAVGEVVSVDRDPKAVERFEKHLLENFAPETRPPVLAYVSNFAELPRLLERLETGLVDGILLDLGLSSDQLNDEGRGFSYQSSGPLDLRFNPMEGEPAWKLLEQTNEKELANLIYEFGEERHSRKVASAIVNARRNSPIRTSGQLAELVRKCVPRSRNHAIDPATRTFQALRIAVNHELKWVSDALDRLPDLLKPGGRIAVISFHSLEDRLVKNAFRENDTLSVLTKKPVRPTDQEIEINPRSRSSRLRVAEKKQV